MFDQAAGMEMEPTSVAAAWAAFEPIKARLVSYLRSSETEFIGLIQALDACWSMAESVEQATAQLAGQSPAGSGSAAIRGSLLEGCRMFTEFLAQIQVARGQLGRAEEETKGVLRTSNLSQDDLVALTHIAFHLRLESCLLATKHSASVLHGHEEMIEVLGGMKRASDSQQATLLTILEKLGAALRTMERASAAYGEGALASEKRIQHHVDLLETVPSGRMESRSRAAGLGGRMASSIREAVKALQGHDAIRQRLEHILNALAAIRNDARNDPGSALLLQRQQAKSVLELIISAGGRVVVELNGVIGPAQELAEDSYRLASSAAEVERFEDAVDRLVSLSAGVAELLDGEARMGELVLTEIEPIGELLRSNSEELEALTRSMKRLKILALNVMVSADKMPSARGIGVLSAWTAEAAQRSMNLANDLDGQFAKLNTNLQSHARDITGQVHKIAAYREVLQTLRADDKLRNSRRLESDEVGRLSLNAQQLKEKMEGLLQSLKFVDEGSSLLGELDRLLGWLLALYPPPARPVDHAQAASGYTMQEQHAVYAGVFGGAETIAHGRLTEPAEGQDFGANVELF